MRRRSWSLLTSGATRRSGREIFDIFGDVHDGARVLLQREDERGGGRAPVVRGMIVAGEDERFEMLEWLRAHAVLRNIEFRRPDNRVEDQSAEIRVPPVRVEMAAREAETAPAIGALDGPADRKVVRLLRRMRNDDGLEARVIFAEPNVVIIFLLRGERLDAAQDGMTWCAQLRLGLPGLNGGIPMVRRVAGFIIEMSADPFRNLVVDAHGTERAPVKEHEAAAALHLPFDDLPMIAGVKRVIFFLAIRAVGGQEDRVGIVECRGVLGPGVKMRLDEHLALQIGRSVEQVFEQDDIFFVFVRLLRMAGNGSGDEHDFLRMVCGLIWSSSRAKRSKSTQQNQDRSAEGKWHSRLPLESRITKGESSV